MKQVWISGLVKQLVALLLRKRKVRGSNPTVGKTISFLYVSFALCFSQLERARANEINHDITSKYPVLDIGSEKIPAAVSHFL